MARKALLSWIGLCLACSQPLGRRSGVDAADVDTAAVDSPQGADTFDTRASLAEAAMILRDGFSSEGADAPILEVGNPWTDASWIIDGPCSDYPSNLLQVLATSLGSPFCARTGSSQPDGYIDFDSDGRVTFSTGYRVPDDKEAWVESLAAYRWPCLASQIIAYGCS